MKNRDTFIFYRSIFEAAKVLSDKDRLKFYDAVVDFSLNFKEPKLTGIPSAMFILVRPTLDKSNKGYMAGKGKHPARVPPRVPPRVPTDNKDKDKDKDKEGDGNADTPPPFFRVYMDVLDYLKDQGKDNLKISVPFEDITVKVSEYGKPYNSVSLNDLDRKQETRFLTYLMNNTQLI